MHLHNIFWTPCKPILVTWSVKQMKILHIVPLHVKQIIAQIGHIVPLLLKQITAQIGHIVPLLLKQITAQISHIVPETNYCPNWPYSSTTSETNHCPNWPYTSITSETNHCPNWPYSFTTSETNHCPIGHIVPLLLKQITAQIHMCITSFKVSNFHRDDLSKRARASFMLIPFCSLF